MLTAHKLQYLMPF